MNTSKNYYDAHSITTALRSGQVVFSAAEVDAAMAEMREKSTHISSVQRLGIHVGLSRKYGNGPQFASAYAGGFWLTLLVEDVDGRGDYLFDMLGLPPSLLSTMHTEYEDRAREMAHLWSARYSMDEAACDALLTPQLMAQLEAFQDELERAGLIETSKKSFHVTRPSLQILKAGGTQSGRLNAILARYAAIIADPSLAQEIAEIEAFERAEQAKQLRQEGDDSA